MEFAGETLLGLELSSLCWTALTSNSAPLTDVGLPGFSTSDGVSSGSSCLSRNVCISSKLLGLRVCDAGRTSDSHSKPSARLPLSQHHTVSLPAITQQGSKSGSASCWFCLSCTGLVFSAILGLLHFHMNFSLSLSVSTHRKGSWDPHRHHGITWTRGLFGALLYCPVTREHTISFPFTKGFFNLKTLFGLKNRERSS